MSARKAEPGTAKTIVVEVGPLIVYGFGKQDIARTERLIRDALDSCAREYMMVGPRSKVVRSRVEEAP